MFYYVSFLRPPPQNAHIGSAISITPQIANDLRTELLQAPQDIYFAWVTSSSGTEDIRSSIRSTKVRKLTQWRHENAYRQITVPLPSGARHGQKYRLLLVAGAEDKRKPTAIHLFGSACDVGPFPVISMPITFSLPARSAHASGKQEQVERAYYLTAGDSPISIIVREQTSFDLDKKVWDSGIGLSSWFSTLLSQSGGVESPILTRIREALFFTPFLNAIELGAGTGIVSLVLGTLRSTLFGLSCGGCLLATDLESAMPLLQENISQNQQLLPSQSSRPCPVVLDWDNTELPIQVQDVNEGFDLILMADVTYNTASFGSLVRTLKGIVEIGKTTRKGRPLYVLLGYKERDVEERVLWDMVYEIGLDFKHIGDVPGTGGPPVEVWISIQTFSTDSSESELCTNGS